MDSCSLDMGMVVAMTDSYMLVEEEEVEVVVVVVEIARVGEGVVVAMTEMILPVASLSAA